MDCPACRSSFRVPETSKTRPKSGAGKNIYILWSIIGLLVLTNALAIFFWRRDEQELRSATRSSEKLTATSSTSSPQPSQSISVLMDTADAALVNYNLPKFKQLLDAHPEIINQYYSKDSTTLLNSAAWWGRVDAVEELLKRKADVNARNVYGHTPLYYCISHNGTKAIAQMLLDHGADFTIAGNDGKTPLQLAVEKKRQDIIELLQQHGAKE